MTTVFEEQLQSAIKAYEDAIAGGQYDDGSDMGPARCTQLRTACLAAIQRAVGTNSVYFQQAQEHKQVGYEFVHLASVVGVCRSLLTDIRNNYLRSLAEVIHSDVFADYLEMADHLNSSGYKDAATVIAGSTLEAHLKSLAAKFAVSTLTAGKPIKADTLNADLARVNAYTKIDQKNVTAWLGLRNDAAHGNYGGYTQSQVTVLISSLREFISRNPA
jgi:hypothetical protein